MCPALSSRLWQLVYGEYTFDESQLTVDVTAYGKPYCGRLWRWAQRAAYVFSDCS